MRDVIGQNLQVGDVVIPSSGSTGYMKPAVVTRLGSEESQKVQLDGCSYYQCSYLVKINEQIKLSKGVAYFNALVEEQRHNFNTEAVAKKEPSARYCVLLANNRANGTDKFYCIKLTGKKSEYSKQMCTFTDSLGINRWDAKCLIVTREDELKFVDYWGRGVAFDQSARFIKDLSIPPETAEITDHAIIAKLESIKQSRY